jgi:hypothetical protein
MKRIRLVGTRSLLLLLGVAAPVYPKQQEPDKQEQDQNKPQAKPDRTEGRFGIARITERFEFRRRLKRASAEIR